MIEHFHPWQIAIIGILIGAALFAGGMFAASH
jgi:hypothetical protein